MSVEDTKEELFEYGRWAAIKANRGMYYQPMGYYDTQTKSEPIAICIDRALYLDRVIAGVKWHDEQGYQALTRYLIQRKTYPEIAKDLKCGRTKAENMVNNTISMVHGILIAQDVVFRD